jgi:4-hydroxybenzoyl-CoA thioesterase
MTMAAPFISEETVQFRHCDPAGIVFYPRYFELINDFVEAWFARGLGASFHDLHMGRAIGTPLASVQCDFLSPSSWNDTLRQTLTVRHIGGASVRIDVLFQGTDGGVRLRASLTVVTIDLGTMRSMRIPDDLRAAMTGFFIETA